jgi:phage FluMu gp28-like protein
MGTISFIRITISWQAHKKENSSSVIKACPYTKQSKAMMWLVTGIPPLAPSSL